MVFGNELSNSVIYIYPRPTSDAIVKNEIWEKITKFEKFWR